MRGHLLATCGVVSDIEPALKYIRDRNAVAMQGSPKHGFRIARLAHHDVRCLAGLGLPEPKTSQRVVRHVLEIEMRNHAAHKSEAQPIAGSEQAETGSAVGLR